MSEVIDFTNCKRSYIPYGGSDQKFGVIYNGDVYMLKFADNHAKRSDVSTSYVNNVISEYISSHIAKDIGLPAHETKLGTYDGKLVVACKDFKFQSNGHIVEFTDLMRAKYNSKEINKPLLLSQLYDTIESKENDLPKNLQKEAIERYWDTFVFDALVGNFDRHPGNWGYILKDNELTPAPVYDCGSTLFPNLSDDGMADMLHSKYELWKRCLVFPSPVLCVTTEKTGKVGYYEMLSSGYDKNCTEAVLRIVPKIDINKINNTIDNAPLISETRKMFYKTIVSLRKELILDRAYEKCISQEYDKDSYDRICEGRPFSERELDILFKDDSDRYLFAIKKALSEAANSKDKYLANPFSKEAKKHTNSFDRSIKEAKRLINITIGEKTGDDLEKFKEIIKGFKGYDMLGTLSKNVDKEKKWNIDH